MILNLLLIVTMFMSFIACAEDQKADNAWDNIGITTPSLEKNGEGLGPLGPYEALKDWTSLPKDELKRRVDYLSVVKVKKPDSNETMFVDSKDILDGKYQSYFAVLPKAYADSAQLGSTRLFSSDTSPSSTPDLAEPTTNEWSSEMVTNLGYTIILFGCFMLIMSFIMIKAGMSANSILRINGLTLVIISSVFLVIVGYSQEQIAPVIGLLGAVAGYLLGNSNKEQTVT